MLSAAFPAHAEETAGGGAAAIYEKLGRAVFQIRLIDKSSGEKNTIGSGFLVSSDGRFITNYHVVSKAIKDPDKYRIEYLHEEGDSGDLSIVTIDVVNDLALLKNSGETDFFLNISEKEPQKGGHIFSMGNPHDLGMTIIEGVYNGLLDNTFYEKILFSGTLNPGMSGGPAFDDKGNVIGVNVAIKGDDIGYLVPAKFVMALMVEADEKLAEAQGEEEKLWDKTIENQLFENQKSVFEKLMEGDWDSQKLGLFTLPRNMSPAVKCWGDGHVEDEDQHHSHSWVTCYSEDTIYVSPSFDTGRVSYSVEQFQSERLSNMGFAGFYMERFGSPSRYNGSRRESDATEFSCRSEFLDLARRKWKAVLCVRQYKNMPSLYDTYMAAVLLSDKKDGYLIQINLQGVAQENATRFYKRFLSYVDG